MRSFYFDKRAFKAPHARLWTNSYSTLVSCPSGDFNQLAQCLYFLMHSTLAIFYSMFSLWLGCGHCAEPKTGSCTFAFNKDLLKEVMGYNVYHVISHSGLWTSWKVRNVTEGGLPFPPSWYSGSAVVSHCSWGNSSYSSGVWGQTEGCEPLGVWTSSTHPVALGWHFNICSCHRTAAY